VVDADETVIGIDDDPGFRVLLKLCIYDLPDSLIELLHRFIGLGAETGVVEHRKVHKDEVGAIGIDDADRPGCLLVFGSVSGEGDTNLVLEVNRLDQLTGGNHSLLRLGKFCDEVVDGSTGGDRPTDGGRGQAGLVSRLVEGMRLNLAEIPVPFARMLAERVEDQVRVDAVLGRPDAGDQGAMARISDRRNDPNDAFSIGSARKRSSTGA
jgi:hypothetical protein